MNGKKDMENNIISLKGFKLVYQGGHHNIYCNGKEHLKTSGGKCHPNMYTKYAIVDYTFKCDCEDFKEKCC